MTARDCPTCGAPCDANSSLYGAATPGPGDVAICLYCADFHVYADDQGSKRAPTEDERAEFLADKRIVAVIAGVRELHMRHPELKDRCVQ